MTMCISGIVVGRRAHARSAHIVELLLGFIVHRRAVMMIIVTTAGRYTDTNISSGSVHCTTATYVLYAKCNR